jgi:hypothetical protein
VVGNFLGESFLENERRRLRNGTENVNGYGDAYCQIGLKQGRSDMKRFAIVVAILTVLGIGVCLAAGPGDNQSYQGLFKMYKTADGSIILNPVVDKNACGPAKTGYYPYYMPMPPTPYYGQYGYGMNPWFPRLYSHRVERMRMERPRLNVPSPCASGNCPSGTCPVTAPPLTDAEAVKDPTGPNDHHGPGPMPGPMPGPRPGPMPGPHFDQGHHYGWGRPSPYFNIAPYIVGPVINYATQPRMVQNPMTGQMELLTPGRWQQTAQGVWAYVNLPVWPLGSSVESAAADVAGPVAHRVIGVLSKIKPIQRIANLIKAVRGHKPLRSFFQERKPVRKVIGRVIHRKG